MKTVRDLVETYQQMNEVKRKTFPQTKLPMNQTQRMGLEQILDANNGYLFKYVIVPLADDSKNVMDMKNKILKNSEVRKNQNLYYVLELLKDDDRFWNEIFELSKAGIYRGRTGISSPHI